MFQYLLNKLIVIGYTNEQLDIPQQLFLQICPLGQSMSPVHASTENINMIIHDVVALDNH